MSAAGDPWAAAVRALLEQVGKAGDPALADQVAALLGATVAELADRPARERALGALLGQLEALGAGLAGDDAAAQAAARTRLETWDDALRAAGLGPLPAAPPGWLGALVGDRPDEVASGLLRRAAGALDGTGEDPEALAAELRSLAGPVASAMEAADQARLKREVTDSVRSALSGLRFGPLGGPD